MKKAVFFAVVTAILILSGPPAAMATDVDGSGNTISSPYWQANASGGVITMIAITNPSTTYSTSRSVSIAVVSAAGSTVDTKTVGVGRGHTTKIFIVNSNSSIYTANVNNSDGVVSVEPGTAKNGNLIFKTTQGDFAEELSFWGVIFNTTTWSGFAMPFFGDLEDSLRTSTDKGL